MNKILDSQNPESLLEEAKVQFFKSNTVSSNLYLGRFSLIQVCHLVSQNTLETSKKAVIMLAKIDLTNKSKMTYWYRESLARMLTYLPKTLPFLPSSSQIMKQLYQECESQVPDILKTHDCWPAMHALITYTGGEDIRQLGLSLVNAFLKISTTKDDKTRIDNKNDLAKSALEVALEAKLKTLTFEALLMYPEKQLEFLGVTPNVFTHEGFGCKYTLTCASIISKSIEIKAEPIRKVYKALSILLSQFPTLNQPIDTNIFVVCVEFYRKYDEPIEYFYCLMNKILDQMLGIRLEIVVHDKGKKNSNSRVVVDPSISSDFDENGILRVDRESIAPLCTTKPADMAKCNRNFNTILHTWLFFLRLRGFSFRDRFQELAYQMIRSYWDWIRDDLNKKRMEPDNIYTAIKEFCFAYANEPSKEKTEYLLKKVAENSAMKKKFGAHRANEYLTKCKL